MKVLLFGYFLLTGITWVAGETGVGISGRLTLSDPVLCLLIAVAAVRGGGRLKVPSIGLAALAMVVLFAPGVVFVSTKTGSLLNWLIHAFLVVGFIGLYNLSLALPLEQRFEIIQSWVRACGILALVACYDLVGPLLGLPGVASIFGRTTGLQGAVIGGAVGTFRNTGQAGMFFVTAFALAVPLTRVISGRARREAVIWAVVLALGVIMSVKRSALIALILGTFLLLLWDHSWSGKLRTIVLVCASIVALMPAYLWVYENSEAFRWRFDSKTQTAVSVLDEESFFMDNLRSGFSAFLDHPIVGVGLAGVAGNYTERHEIHSTYGSVLAETGVLGTAGYLLFVLLLFRDCTRARNADPRTRQFAYLLVPLLLALFVSFTYTNHLRKREFWITAALASALMAPDSKRRARPATWISDGNMLANNEPSPT